MKIESDLLIGQIASAEIIGIPRHGLIDDDAILASHPSQSLFEIGGEIATPERNDSDADGRCVTIQGNAVQRRDFRRPQPGPCARTGKGAQTIYPHRR